ncbi:hypothetical protein CVT24_007416 [Panaeolus cyanescens]|uniref:Uncharacterized protein n=1 Tax=Panaeolus cyanescens TaxID=181874 RepID=A0A409YKZ1_9AGAR|nr:hypothetical protein CVT24_007416 [Panaeolus cyanescens]
MAEVTAPSPHVLLVDLARLPPKSLGPCDILYVASDTKFTNKEVNIGLAPDIGTLAHLPNVHEQTYTSCGFSAAEALSIGLVSRVVEGGRAEVVKEALDLVKDHSVPENLAYTGAWKTLALMTNGIAEAVHVTPQKDKANEVVNAVKLCAK